MSDSNEEHELVIKTPKQLVYVVLACFIVPIVVIVLLVNYVITGDKPAAGSDALTEEAIAQRLAPVAKLAFEDASTPRALQAGSAVYAAACAACHGSGAAGAPKFGDNGQWATRLTQGFDTLVRHAINGIGAMPAKGGNAKLDDIEVARAVAYMGNEAGANYTEPDPPTEQAAQ